MNRLARENRAPLGTETSLFSVVGRFKWPALIRDSAWVLIVNHTLINCISEQFLVPRVHEVAVKAVPGSIAVRKHVLSALESIDLIHGVVNLEEEMRKENWVRRWAYAAIYSRKVGDMRLVWFVEVLAIPAGLEVDLSSQTLWAVDVGKVVGLRSWLSIVDASEACALRKQTASRQDALCVEAACAVVAGDHLEAWWEWLDTIAVVLTAAEIVNGHPAVGNLFVCAIGMSKVELRGPICGLVALDLARCA